MISFLSRGEDAAAVRVTPFRYGDRRMLFARARLFEDRLELSGLHWRGWHQRTIPLSQIKSVDWWSGAESGPNFVLHLRNSDSLSLWMKGAGLWKYRIEEHAPNLTDEQSRRPDRDMASAA